MTEENKEVITPTEATPEEIKEVLQETKEEAAA